MKDLISTIKYIAQKSNDLKNKLPEVVSASIEFTCIFCQTEKEYKSFVDEINSLGKIVERTSKGNTYFLDKPILTISGPLRFVKIRMPDPLRPERGDADFNINCEDFSNKYKNDPRFELVKREDFKYLRYSDSNFNVMACFSDIPKSKVLGIKL